MDECSNVFVFVWIPSARNRMCLVFWTVFISLSFSRSLMPRIPICMHCSSFGSLCVHKALYSVNRFGMAAEWLQFDYIFITLNCQINICFFIIIVVIILFEFNKSQLNSWWDSIHHRIITSFTCMKNDALCWCCCRRCQTAEMENNSTYRWIIHKQSKVISIFVNFFSIILLLTASLWLCYGFIDIHTLVRSCSVFVDYLSDIRGSFAL